MVDLQPRAMQEHMVLLLVSSLKHFQHALLRSAETPTYTRVHTHIYTLHITHILPFEEELFWLHPGERRLTGLRSNYSSWQTHIIHHSKFRERYPTYKDYSTATTPGPSPVTQSITQDGEQFTYRDAPCMIPCCLLI